MSRASRIRRSLRRASLNDDSLEALLASALSIELSNRRGKDSVKTIRRVESVLHQTFANPNNWEDKGILMLIYVDEATGQQTTIGLFQDLRHRWNEARRLTRVTDDRFNEPGSYQVGQEVSTDPFLVHGKLNPCPSSTPQNLYERDAIRQYLARTEPQKLDEFLGVSKPDAAKLLKQLRDMGVEKLR